jgi:hypothetical protein
MGNFKKHSATWVYVDKDDGVIFTSIKHHSISTLHSENRIDSDSYRKTGFNRRGFDTSRFRSSSGHSATWVYVDKDDGVIFTSIKHHSISTLHSENRIDSDSYRKTGLNSRGFYTSRFRSSSGHSATWVYVDKDDGVIFTSIKHHSITTLHSENRIEITGFNRRGFDTSRFRSSSGHSATWVYVDKDDGVIFTSIKHHSISTLHSENRIEITGFNRRGFDTSRFRSSSGHSATWVYVDKGD